MHVCTCKIVMSQSEECEHFKDILYKWYYDRIEYVLFIFDLVLYV